MVSLFWPAYDDCKTDAAHVAPAQQCQAERLRATRCGEEKLAAAPESRYHVRTPVGSTVAYGACEETLASEWNHTQWPCSDGGCERSASGGEEAGR